jgi:Fe(3+) dicitrate transport protein
MTAIYAGKKTEVIDVSKLIANKATNNTRQIFAQVVGLTINESSDGGLQLSIGGRGLDPNRTSNFNTRQNGYDISADVLGYPESYYATPTEALEEIQIIRGAASLQYGTQFGGLVNFKLKSPTEKPFELTTRNTLGSYGLYTNFTSISGTNKKFSYYSFYNYKKGNGFRPNSDFESKNYFANLNYKFNDKTSLHFDYTYFTYLAQQAGGLTDARLEFICS